MLTEEHSGKSLQCIENIVNVTVLTAVASRITCRVPASIALTDKAQLTGAAGNDTHPLESTETNCCVYRICTVSILRC